MTMMKNEAFSSNKQSSKGKTHYIPNLAGENLFGSINTDNTGHGL